MLVCVHLYTYMYVHRDDTIRVALIPQLRWIQLLTLLHVCLCVTDQTREAVLHCRSGGGLAGEYFLILFAGTCKRDDIASPDITRPRHIMSSEARHVRRLLITHFLFPGDRYKIRANLNARTRLVGFAETSTINYGSN